MSKNKLSNDWSVQSVSDIFYIGSGEAASYRSNDLSGPVLVYGANGPIGSYDHANYGPGYIIGRVGTTGEVTKVSFRVWASDNTLTATPKVGVCDHDFGGYLLEFLNLPRLATKNAQPLLTQTNIASLCAIISENVEEQRRIAEILDIIDKAIQKTEALISKLKAMKQGLLHDLLTRGLDKNGKLRDLKAHPEQFKDSPLGRIPKEWETVMLRDEVDILHGYAFEGKYFSERPPGEVLLVPGNFHREGQLYFEENNTKYFCGPIPEGTVLNNGDILIVMTDLSPRTLILGRVVQLEVPYRVLHNQRIGKIVFKNAETWCTGFFVAIMNDEKFRHNIIINATGTTVRHTSPDRVLSNTTVKPRLDEQERLAIVVDTHDARIRAEEQYRDKLKLQKKGLMHDLLTGKVRVQI